MQQIYDDIFGKLLCYFYVYFVLFEQIINFAHYLYNHYEETDSFCNQ